MALLPMLNVAIHIVSEDLLPPLPAKINIGAGSDSAIPTADVSLMLCLRTSGPNTTSISEYMNTITMPSCPSCESAYSVSPRALIPPAIIAKSGKRFRAGGVLIKW
ncbi:hypothetical protein [Vreelandella sp. H-I2]